MRLETSFDVGCSRDRALAVLDLDETLIGLFPDTKTEIVAREGDRKTAVSHYRALGQEGEATFHFDFLVDGTVRFQKVCDGRVWRELRGEVAVEDLREDRVRVTVEMEGRTKGFVPEFTIKGQMKEQLEQMARGLRERMEAAR